MLETRDTYISHLLQKITDLEEQLLEASTLYTAIKDGSIDAFVFNKEGRSDIFALESIDYTYRILIEKCGEGALSISPDGLVLYCNEYFSNLLSLPGSKIVGSYLHEHLSSPEKLGDLLLELKAGLSKGELLLTTPGGEIPVYMSLTNLQPYMPAIGIIVTDQTQNKRHQEEIYQYQKELETKLKELNTTNRELEQFVHIISHDIKEPLRKILSYGERLKSELSGELQERSMKNLRVIYEASNRLNLLVDDLVQYSFALRDKSEFVETDLERVLKNVLDDIEMLIEEKRARITRPLMPKILGSPVQMRQLFSNLLINAIKYAKTGKVPEIQIHHELVNGGTENNPVVYHKISVADNGIGIEDQYLQKIFTIFQRLHSQGEYSGTGVGLAICKKIVENHLGKIEVESVLNKGSRFSVYLPVIGSSDGTQELTHTHCGR